MAARFGAGGVQPSDTDLETFAAADDPTIGCDVLTGSCEA
jgi:hypothetical protein